MVKVEIIVDNFMSGTKHVPKGQTVEVAQVVANYIIGNKEGKLFTIAKKKSTRKSQYKTIDMEAE